eukprot:1194940-Prorocentrum_minimum.AAC.8
MDHTRACLSIMVRLPCTSCESRTRPMPLQVGQLAFRVRVAVADFVCLACVGLRGARACAGIVLGRGSACDDRGRLLVRLDWRLWRTQNDPSDDGT